MAAMLYSKNVIKEKAINEKGEDLLIQIKEAVCSDYKKINAFAVILCKSMTTSEIGNAIKKAYSKGSIIT